MARIYLHPLPVRIWHWINAVTCVLLFLTGIQLRYIGLIDVVSFQTAVITHNVLGFILIANFCLWLGFYLCSPRIRAYHAETNPVRYFHRRRARRRCITATASSATCPPRSVPRRIASSIRCRP